MKAYRYLTPGQVMDAYPVIYHDAAQPDKAQKWLYLHEVYSRHQNNWQMGAQWRQYRGIITWNPRVYATYRDQYPMVYCRQYGNMWVEYLPDPLPFAERAPETVCCIYGRPASIDMPIMLARYDVPLALYRSGIEVHAYGTTPSVQRPEYRKEWGEIFCGPLPLHRKSDALGVHRFSVAFENSQDDFWAVGWVTEKLYDCLGCGCIPIYWGAPDISDHVPPEVFIDYRHFTNFADLIAYLRGTPLSVFERMARDGWEFFNTLQFDEYLEVLAQLESSTVAFDRAS